MTTPARTRTCAHQRLHHPPSYAPEKPCAVCATTLRPANYREARAETCSWDCRRVLMGWRVREAKARIREARSA